MHGMEDVKKGAYKLLVNIVIIWDTHTEVSVCFVSSSMMCR